ncbi:cytidylate kinase [Clostridium tetani]|uniref:Cytidylate kinase n=1 Tax=Clostridium tetani (strain Massachusetts / E88) TaxID=212717 RepID=KCY_CLOTE|nr:(d)CMP kinase [Clostridium tetani]Q895G1.1 RecName: Full=Cytidylate kinase; Short=CK; AltName: Full=Cytidine monophosphate kinase; Short=CMP kinase [Clostridium tetani E88]AAO35879.1 cytidylate kinase [Clostridium tetani E88]AVP53779.1 cytidylate kinase [Clostridium tetani]KGI38211.1 cytidylate kinase [Clostridium tetani]KGI40087.1 cytidylate kinase [Clostridium tetani ATCC 9441]KGI41838.1 cytidylate kinase [Clostridium tetani]
MRVLVAIDGPAGAGKSTIAKLVAKKFNLMYIDTGAMYRAITYLAQNKNITPSNVEGLCNLINSISMYFKDDKIIVNGEDLSEEIRKPNVSSNVSLYASVLEVRTLLVDIQKDLACKYEVVMDGRDIGTVVMPHAPFKFFLTATPEIRADRRYKELKEKSQKVEYKNILEEIIKRDYIDSNRKVSPLKKAKDAIEIDTTNYHIEEVVDKISKLIESTIIKEKGRITK